ncbi:hypothetical protein EZS27_011215 [termite gut metagenome]|jgi:hypothetical protein|uniref:Uncharacterized protein n=1 Tax=termite gut metagenome TaxID=433724 RepID=A0A5J4S4H8_9ZZZZ
MITDINHKTIIKTLDKSKLAIYWCQYFDYEKDRKLFGLTKTALITEVYKIKKNTKPFIDSQIVISKILTNFGVKSVFHREFNARHSKLHKEQVLGMQLYSIMLEDNEIWIYCETQHKGHLSPHATYFKDNSFKSENTNRL